jgi:O-methyltransferase
MGIQTFKRRVRSLLWRALGPPPITQSAVVVRNSRDRPIDTLIGRDTAVDMAVMNMHIATRVERAEANGDDTLLGDYAEFGVFQGRTFIHAYHRAASLMPWMRFFAFDSFDGLPEPRGVDVGGEFWKGQFACTKDRFLDNLRAARVETDRVRIAEGSFDQTLTPEFIQQSHLKCIAIAYIDCDLYESAVPVFAFLTNLLRQGSILLIDDWHNFRSDPRRGIQLAVHEWLAVNQIIRLEPWYDFSSHGKAFFVTRDTTHRDTDERRDDEAVAVGRSERQRPQIP